jgi:hypothetical protein
MLLAGCLLHSQSDGRHYAWVGSPFVGVRSLQNSKIPSRSGTTEVIEGKKKSGAPGEIRSPAPEAIKTPSLYVESSIYSGSTMAL